MSAHASRSFAKEYPGLYSEKDKPYPPEGLASLLTRTKAFTSCFARPCELV